MQTLVVIPARFASTRLPGKPLVDLAGKPMVQHVHERATAAKLAARVVVATDDARIVDVVEAFGGEARLTSPHCATGTDRVAELVAILEAEGAQIDAVLNLQGDEPFVEPAAIERAFAALASVPAAGVAPIATLSRPLQPDELDDPAVVKVVVDLDDHALTFSRAPLGRDRDDPHRSVASAHVGLYAFTREALADFRNLSPSPLEQAERLEQLRALEHGRTIAVAHGPWRGQSIDTPEDLARARADLQHRTRS